MGTRELVARLKVPLEDLTTQVLEIPSLEGIVDTMRASSHWFRFVFLSFTKTTLPLTGSGLDFHHFSLLMSVCK